MMRTSTDEVVGIHLVPAHMRDSIIQWIEDPFPPHMIGSFLYSLLTNDLRGCIDHGDMENVASLRNWVVFLYNYAPSNCWGSVEKVIGWYDAHAQRKADQDVANG